LPQFDLNEIYYTDVSIKHAFCENKLSVSLMLSDLFNTRKWEISSDNPVYKLVNLNKIESRILWIGITYNFNSFKLIKTQKTDNQEMDNNIIKLGQ
jgi:hypothetical protein